MGAQVQEQVGHEFRGAFQKGYGGGFEACKVKAAGLRGWIGHAVSPCVLLGYVQVRLCWGNKVRIEWGESILGISVARCWWARWLW